ncbi:MAG: hypothetical protein RI591_00555 [Dehalococcoidia bacterium]|nr:hypothetical protein [Dehalococcoidia bacterium]
MRCASHPDIETNVSCGRCGKPVCPKCMVQTLVGPRCPDCANLKRLPTYEISTRHYLIAIGVGVGVAIVAGIAWALIWRAIPFLSLLTAAGVGYAIGELISRATNRKRGPGLQVIAGVSVLISFATNYLFAAYVLSVPWFSLYTIIGLALGIFIAVTRLR